MSKNISETKETTRGSESVSTISICDVMKENTTAIIEKLEAQVPINLQQYSDLYAEYLHSLDIIFGSCYISQKEFFDKLGFDQKTLEYYKNYWDSLTKMSLSQIDMYTGIQALYTKTRIAAMKSYNQYVKLAMDNYAQTLSQFNRRFKQ